MNINDCKKCLYHRKVMSDSVVCNYQNQANYFVIDTGIIISCPKELPGKKKVKDLFIIV
jgi:hypothetical protein